MDTFFEQIVAIRKTGKSWAAFFGIWIAAIVLVALIVMFLMGLFAVAVLLVMGVFYGAYKLSSRLSVEYEYCITNGSFDVDRIIAKSSRRKEISCELAHVERLEKYRPGAPIGGNFKKVVMACNPDDPGAYCLVVDEEGKGCRMVVFAPDERLRGAMIKFLPKFIANSAFKD